MATKKNITTERTCNKLKRARDRKRWAECQQRAQAYLAEHPKAMFYEVDAEVGETWIDQMNSTKNDKGELVTRVYLPYTDSHPDAKGGFAQAQHSEEEMLTVEITPEMADRLPKEKMEALRQVLAADPRPRYQDNPERIYGFAFADREIHFRVKEGTLTVTSIS